MRHTRSRRIAVARVRLAHRGLSGPCLAAAVLMAGATDADGGAVFIDSTAGAGLDQVQYEITDPPDLRGLIYMTGGAAAGDYDGDGLVDVYVTRFDAADSLFRNNGDGTFEDVTVDAGFTVPLLTSNGAAWGDIDNDGDLDLYVTTVLDTRFYLFINDGNGHFTEEGIERGAAVAGTDTHYGMSSTFGDYDQDGWLDIHTTEWRRNDLNPTGAPPNARLLRNLGGQAPGHFEDVTVSAGVSLAGYHAGGSFSFASRFADLDLDGWPDLAITSDFGTSRLFWNNRDGTFTDGTVSAGVGTDENGMGSAIGDWDGDGLLDWFVTSIYDPPCEFQPCGWGFSGNRLYRNLGDRTFADVTDLADVRNGYWGWGASFFDYDNDGDLDLVHTNGVDFAGSPFDKPFNDDPMRLWNNNGAGIMTEVSAPSGMTDTGNGKGLLVFDYDVDGDPDVLVLNNADYPVLYRNFGGNDKDWLRVETRGWTNAQGIGARVTATAGPGAPIQVREINCGSHFLGQSDTAAHFGLGTGMDPVEQVSVRWPMTYTLTTYADVPRNTTLVAQEPAPPLQLQINGSHPWSRQLTTTGQARISIDMEPGPFTDALGWYFAVRFDGQPWVFMTPGGYSPLPAPLITAPPIPLADVVIARHDFPPGTAFVVAGFLADGATIVAMDYLSCVVMAGAAAPEGAGGGAALDGAQGAAPPSGAGSAAGPVAPPGGLTIISEFEALLMGAGEAP